MTSKLCNPEYYRGVVLEIRKSLEVREEGMEVQEEAAINMLFLFPPYNSHVHSIKFIIPKLPLFLLYGNGVGMPLLVFVEVGVESSWRRWRC